MAARRRLSSLFGNEVELFVRNEESWLAKLDMASDEIELLK